jgi:probable rRNA maturation factor
VNKIHFFQEETSYVVKHKTRIKDWVITCVINERKTLGDLNYIICSDPYLRALNKEHLDHDYETDIVTFDYCSDHLLSGDLFISIDRIRANAADLKVSVQDELHRVLIHGVLHLAGYQDKLPEEQVIMRSKEDYCLTLRSF